MSQQNPAPLPGKVLSVYFTGGLVRRKYNFLFGLHPDGWRCVGAPDVAPHLEGKPAEDIQKWVKDVGGIYSWVM